MEFILFTKPLINKEIKDVVLIARDLGFDGLDLLIRDGAHIKPSDDFSNNLNEIIQLAKTYGLDIPMVTADIIDPKCRWARTFIKGCYVNNVSMFRLGFWRFTFGNFNKTLQKARKDISGFEKLCSPYKIRGLLQVHQENMLHSSASGTLRILQDLNLKNIKVYLDPGNMMRGGFEDWELCFDILSGYIGCIGIKDVEWYKDKDCKWRQRWAPLGKGIVDWHNIFQLVKRIGYDGVLSFHAPYETNFKDWFKKAKNDISFIKKVIGRD